MKTLRIILLILSLGSAAYAEIIASVNYFQYTKTDQIGEAPRTTSLLTSYDLNFQLLISSRYSVGVAYMTQTTSAGDIRGKKEVMAPNVGMFFGPLLIEAGPISRSTEKLNIDVEGEWRDGSGYYAALTVYDRWASWLLVGFQFTFLDIEYKKYFDGQVESSVLSRRTTVLNPSIRLGFLF
jgi:hypothetical protein